MALTIRNSVVLHHVIVPKRREIAAQKNTDRSATKRKTETVAAEDQPTRRRLGALSTASALLLSVLLGVLAVNRAVAQEAPQAFTPDPAEACEGKDPGTSCWMEIADHPGCYTWNPNLAANETVTWSGDCSGGLAQGTGSQQWSHPDDEGNPLVSGGEGELRDGKEHGPWSEYFSNGNMAEGSYEHGEPVGRWTHVLADGTVYEGEWANGKQQGRWTVTYGDAVGGGFYAAGKRHGRWKLLFANRFDDTNRGAAEGLYVAGDRDGLWVTRYESGLVEEDTYRNGVRHGPSSTRRGSDYEVEGPYEDGKRHGRWTRRDGGIVESGEYKRGLKQGTWTTRYGSGLEEASTYAEGSMVGPYSRRDASGAVIEEGSYGCRTSYCRSKFDGDLFKTGMWKERDHHRTASGGFDPKSRHSAEGPYVDGERHGQWVLEYDDGRREEGPYRYGKKDGLWKASRDGVNERRAMFVRGERSGEWKRVGRWVIRRRSGTDGIPADTITSEGSYDADGRKTGEWVERVHEALEGEWVCCITSRGAYVEGKREGRWEYSRPSGFSSVSFYREGLLHGPLTKRIPDVYMETEYFILGEYATRKQWNRWVKANRRQ